MSFVSLVITVFNREQYLGAAIESVLSQTYGDFELVVWDDGSTDRSLEVAQEYAQKDARVRVIAAAHEGRVPALQAAIAQTNGTYLGWIDSDDLLAPQALEETVPFLDRHPETGMVYTDYLNINEVGEVIGYGHRCRIPYSKDRLLLDFMTFHFRLLRRSVFDQVGGIDGSLNFVEDYDLCLRLSEVTAVRRVYKPLYYYRHHSRNASRQWRLEQLLRARSVVRQALKRRGLAAHVELDVQFPEGRFLLRRKQPLKGAAEQRAEAVGGQHAILQGRQAWPPLVAMGVVPLLVTLPLVTLISTTIGATIGTTTVHAQTIIPANDGTNTIVTPTSNQFNISGGQLSGNGANLFQSFERFGLNQGQIANFLSNPAIQNILGRVVGGDPSIINGLIRVTGGNSHLFLVNPAGIVFGPNASLNVPASFMATTATGVGFGSQWLNAIGPADYTNLNGNPQAFAFAVNQPGAIVNAGNLAVNTGQSLAFLGGTIVNSGQLAAPGGQITILAVPGQNLVRLSQPGSLLSLEISPLSSPSPSLLTPPSLPQLLTGGNLSNATGVIVNPDGTIRLAGTTPDVPMNPGTAVVAGSLTVSGPTAGTVQVLGDRVGILGATITASGNAGGGTVLIGGGYRGQGSVPNAT
ncbi:MAG: glycosyltransferase, partial [Kovacikia sp.]